MGTEGSDFFKGGKGRGWRHLGTATAQQLKIAREKTQERNKMNEMNTKLIKEVRDYFVTVRTYIQRKPRNEQNMKLLQLIDTLLRIDNLLDKEYEDLVEQLQDLIKV